MADVFRRFGNALRQLAAATIRVNNRYAEFVGRYPFFLIPLLPLYLAGVILVSVCIGFSIIWTLSLFGLVHISPSLDEPIIASLLAVIFLGGLSAGHWFFVAWYTVTFVGSLDGSPKSIFRAVQLVGATALFFALVHYYVALFSGPGAYSGMIDLADKNSWLWSEYNRFPRLLTLPPIGMVVDCIYFSFVTMATVGYGDIYPHSIAAKIATVLEILSAFILIVVILARVIGRPELKRDELSAPRSPR
ncbi:hypothetical protein ACVINW_004025 [Bradyrhizobium sp. USDA 4461]